MTNLVSSFARYTSIVAVDWRIISAQTHRYVNNIYFALDNVLKVNKTRESTKAMSLIDLCFGTPTTLIAIDCLSLHTSSPLGLLGPNQ